MSNQQNHSRIAFTLLAIIAIAVLVIVHLLRAGEQYKAERKVTEREAGREWRKTYNGVDYFTTCAEGFKFVVTKGVHGGYQMAGPIGTCSLEDQLSDREREELDKLVEGMFSAKPTTM